MKRLILVSFLLPLMASCQLLLLGGAAGAGTFIWSEGNLERIYINSFDEVWESSLSVIKRFKLKTTRRQRDTHYGIIEAKLLNGETLKIALEKWTHEETKVTVRGGSSGDKATARRIHEAIENALRGRFYGSPPL